MVGGSQVKEAGKLVGSTGAAERLGLHMLYLAGEVRVRVLAAVSPSSLEAKEAREPRRVREQML